MVAGTSACAVTAAVIGGAATRDPAAAIVYLGACATALLVLVVVEALTAAFRLRARAGRRPQARAAHVGAYAHRIAPNSQSPL